MKIREYSLPVGWYPRDKQEVSEKIHLFLEKYGRTAPFSRAAISPHAGWRYCGDIIFRSVSALEPDAETIVILGGHLQAGLPVLFAMEDAVKTPFGVMPLDTEFRAALRKSLGGEEDRYRDNTIEVLLPMVRFFFPQASLVWLRLPNDISSFETGKTIAHTAAKLKRKINVLASTDLTHYGTNYGFSPMGSGFEALSWVREVNDAKFIKAVKEGNADEVLKRAEHDFSACSVGAVLGAIGFAEASGLGGAQLLEYTTSFDAEADAGSPPDFFVGYAAIKFAAETDISFPR